MRDFSAARDRRPLRSRHVPRGGFSVGATSAERHRSRKIGSRPQVGFPERVWHPLCRMALGTGRRALGTTVRRESMAEQGHPPSQQPLCARPPPEEQHDSGPHVPTGRQQHHGCEAIWALTPSTNLSQAATLRLGNAGAASRPWVGAGFRRDPRTIRVRGPPWAASRRGHGSERRVVPPRHGAAALAGQPTGPATPGQPPRLRRARSMTTAWWRMRDTSAIPCTRDPGAMGSHPMWPLCPRRDAPPQPVDGAAGNSTL